MKNKNEKINNENIDVQNAELENDFQLSAKSTSPIKKRIVFPFVEAGLGHIMPMTAVRDAFTEKYGDKCEIINTYFFQETDNEGLKGIEKKLIDEVHKHNKSKFHGFYQFFLMGIAGTQNSIRFLYKVWWKEGFKPALERVKEFDADLIFHTHFATLYYACEAKKLGLTNAKMAMYCPDPVVGKQWDRRAEFVALSSPVGKKRGEKNFGFKKRKTKFEVVPFLIRKQVADYKESREFYREQLEIPTDKFTILLADGAYGVGKLRDAVLELLKSPIPLTIIPVCGRNEKLYEEFEAIIPPAHITFKPFGFTDKMLLLSASCDLFIGKAGASNLAEPCYFGAPAIVTFTATPIEKWICKHYTHSVGSAVKITNVKKAVAKALEWAENRELMQPYIENSKKERRHDGPDKLADLLWERLNEV